MKSQNLLDRIFKFSCSLQLAVIIMFALGVLAAVGTITEARYDADYARRLVYQSPYMYVVLAALCVCLFNVIIDRYPWKPHHLGFITVHIGIIVLCIGALITRLHGLDGSLPIGIGQKNRFVSTNDTEIAVYSMPNNMFMGSNPVMVDSRPVDFLVHPPQADRFEMTIGKKTLVAKDFYNYSLPEQKVVASDDPLAGPAVRIQLQNARADITQWINKAADTPYEAFELGPARIVLTDAKSRYQYKSGNEVVLQTTENPEVLNYQIYSDSTHKQTAHGQMHIADAVDTGWAGFKLRILKFLPKAEEKVEFLKRDQPTGKTISALLVNYDGVDHWVGLNNSARLVGADHMIYYVVYRNRQIDLGFDIHLNKFDVGHYQGTTRASSYQSEVSVPEVGTAQIYMNHPLKYRGFTFYQASFQEDEQGHATTSVLSVNRDPGRPLKYLGSFLIVAGTIIMFYFKQYRVKIFAKLSASDMAAE